MGKIMITIEIEETEAEFLAFTLQNYLENVELVADAKELLEKVVAQLNEKLS
jgi:hypothetical protein